MFLKKGDNEVVEVTNCSFLPMDVEDSIGFDAKNNENNSKRQTRERVDYEGKKWISGEETFG